MPCECGHLAYDHPRQPYSAFPCTIRGCACSEYAEAISDDETAADILDLFSDRLSRDDA